MNAGPDGRHHGHGALGRRAGQPRHVRSVHGRPRRGADGIAAIDTLLSIQIAAVRTAIATLDTRLPTQIADLRSEQGTSNAGLETRLSAIETRLTWRIVGGHCGGWRVLPVLAKTICLFRAVTRVLRRRVARSPTAGWERQRTPAVSRGFHSSFRIWASERANHPREVVEAALADAVRNQTEAVDAAPGGGARPILAAHLMNLRAAVLALGVRRRGPSPPRRDRRAAAPTHTQRRGPLHAQHRFSSAAPRRCSVFRRWTPTAQLKRRCSRQSAGARGTRRTRPNGRR